MKTGRNERKGNEKENWKTTEKGKKGIGFGRKEGPAGRSREKVGKREGEKERNERTAKRHTFFVFNFLQQII